MTKVLSLLTAAVLTGVYLVPLARAESPLPDNSGQMKVEDKAGAFTPAGIQTAEDAFRGTTFRSPTHFAVVTVGEKDVPEAKKADFEAARKDSKLAGPFFHDWTREMARAEGTRGIFSLIYFEGKDFYVVVVTDEQTDVKRHFTDDDARKVRETLIAGFREAKASDDAAERDAALLASTNVVIDQLKSTSAAEPGATGQTRAADSNAKANDGTSIMGYVCIGLAALLGVWLVIGLIRAFSGGGGGGYGGGGYGGGGSFFPGLMGGLFGAAAGMYLYDSFMGGSSTADASDAASGGDVGGGEDTGAGDFDGGAAAGGGDFGDDSGGGGDFGGGDFGGGDFGGGDW